MIFLLISLIQAQKQLIPQACRQQCSSLPLDSCALPSAPNSDDAWNTAAQSLSDCICPKLNAANSCSACLITSAPSASTYFQNLKNLCSQNAAAPEIGKLFGKTITAQTQPSAPPQTDPGQDGTKKSSASALYPVLTIGLVAGVLMF